MITIETFNKVHELISKEVEGGYYHPSMKQYMNARSQKALGDSGETMLGIDLKHGSQLKMYPEWKPFWDMIWSDKKKNTALWKHNYMGGSLYKSLHDLVSTMMYKWFTVLFKRYVSVAAYDEVMNDKRLQAHLIYAAWNGEGNFQKMAAVLNKAVIDFEGNKEKIFQTAFAWRVNNARQVFRQQAENLKRVFKLL